MSRHFVKYFLYATGAFALLLGINVGLTIWRNASTASDFFVLINVPRSVDGIIIIFCGLILLALGWLTQNLQFLLDGQGPIVEIDEKPETKKKSNAKASKARMVLECPNCGQQLRAPGNKSGTIKCPSCSKSFSATT